MANAVVHAVVAADTSVLAGGPYPDALRERIARDMALPRSCP